MLDAPPHQTPSDPADSPEDLTPLAAAAREAIGCDAAIITARPRGGDRFAVVSASGIGWERARELHQVLAKVGAEFADGQLCAIDDLLEDPRTATLADWDDQGFRSLLSAPLQRDGETIGALHLLHAHPLDPDREAKRVATALARHTALAVGFKRLRRRTARLSRDLETLTALDELVLTWRNWHEMDKALIERLASMTGAETGGIMVLDEERELLMMMPGAFGVSEKVVASCQVSLHDPRSNSARVFATGKPYMSNHATGDPAILQEWVDLLHVNRLLSLPLTLGGKRIGVVHLANKPSRFTPSDLERARMVAPRVATVVELARAMFRLRRQQRLEELLSSMAVGVASGRSMEELLSVAFNELCVILEASFAALVPPGRPPLIWRRERKDPAVERAVFGAAEREEGSGELLGAAVPGDPGFSALQAPIRLSGKRIATLVAVRRRAEIFAEDERNALSRLANLAALAWAAEGYQQQRAELARLRERQRIADDLHDHVAQILFAAQINLESLLERPGLTGGVGEGIAHARGLLLKGDTAIREVIHQLSRPHRADLAHRLALLVEGLEEEFGIRIHLDVPEGVASVAKGMRKVLADAMVKVAQEATVNAAKHARPCAVTVRLRITRGGRLLLSVVDDGIGLSEPSRKNRHGLASVRRTLREHGGLLRVEAGPCGGTKVTASVPL